MEDQGEVQYVLYSLTCNTCMRCRSKSSAEVFLHDFPKIADQQELVPQRKRSHPTHALSALIVSTRVRQAIFSTFKLKWKLLKHNMLYLFLLG